MINSNCMGDYVNLKPCVWFYNSLGISIMINFSCMGVYVKHKTMCKGFHFS